MLIADECPVLRFGLRNLLARELRGGLFAEAGSEEQFQMQLPRRHWRLAVIGLPRSIELAHAVRAQEPDVAILQISDSALAGGPGILPRNAEISEYLRAIRHALQGGMYKPLPAGPNKSEPAFNTNSFSPRELYVFNGIVNGKRIKQMAHELNLDIRTVSTYKIRLLKKMGMQTDAEVIRYAIVSKLL